MVLRVALFLSLVTGCVDPSRRIDRLAQHSGFQEETVSGTKFRHRVYRHDGRAGAGLGALHVYIEGDGRPFLGPTVVALDPTPLDPLMLRLMALDPAPSVYLGRPCYFGLSTDGGCDPGYWTVRRFSPEVVDSLAAALRRVAARARAARIEIYGHSGGGTLAVLLAARVTEVTRVITIGANLDTAAWAALHGYTPLLGSLNPVDEGIRLKNVRVLHLVGSEDTNMPPALLESAALRLGMGDSVRVVQGYTHSCCWQEIWSRVIE